MNISIIFFLFLLIFFPPSLSLLTGWIFISSFSHLYHYYVDKIDYLQNFKEMGIIGMGFMTIFSPLYCVVLLQEYGFPKNFKWLPQITITFNTKK